MHLADVEHSRRLCSPKQPKHLRARFTFPHLAGTLSCLNAGQTLQTCSRFPQLSEHLLVAGEADVFPLDRLSTTWSLSARPGAFSSVTTSTVFFLATRLEVDCASSSSSSKWVATLRPRFTDRSCRYRRKSANSFRFPSLGIVTTDWYRDEGDSPARDDLYRSHSSPYLRGSLATRRFTSSGR